MVRKRGGVKGTKRRVEGERETERGREEGGKKREKREQGLSNETRKGWR